MSAVVVGIILLISVVGIAAIFIVPAFLRQRIPWRTLPNTTAKYHALVPISEKALQTAYLSALVQLRTHTDFMPATLNKVAGDLHIVVQSVKDWESPMHNSKVAGIADGKTIYIGVDFAALLHEMAHVAEFIDGAIDNTHATWIKRGIYRADDAFQVSLKSES